MQLQNWQVENPLRRYRERAQLSRAELARQVGVSRQALLAWEVGTAIPHRSASWIRLEAATGDPHLRSDWYVWLAQRPTVASPVSA